MTEITLDVRYIAFGLMALGVLLIAGAFIALIKSNSSLKRRLRSYEEQEIRDSYGRYQNRPYFNEPIRRVEDYSPPKYGYDGYESGMQPEFDADIPKPRQLYTTIPEKNAARTSENSSFIGAQPYEEPIIDDTYGSNRDGDTWEQPMREPVIDRAKVRDGMSKLKSSAASSFSAEKKNLKGLKQLIKEPITSTEDAAARKKIFKKYLWIILGCAVLFSVLMNLKIPVLSSIATILGLVCFLLLIADVLLIFVIGKSAQAINERSCPTCKTQFSYENVAHWEILDVSERMAVNERNGNLKEYTKVGFTCACPKCGAEKSFSHEFCTANITASGKIAVSVSGRAYPLKEQIKDYFEGHLTIVV